MRIALLSIVIVLMSCASTNQNLTSAQLEKFKNTIDTNKIEITFNSARPLGLNNGVRGIEKLLPIGSSLNTINLIGNANFFRMQNDSIHMDLPYYGQQQMPRSYNAESAVMFEGKGEAIQKQIIQKKGTYMLTYVLDAEEENYKINLTMYPNKKSILNVSSSHRTNITYDGQWKILEEKSK